ncbi:MAG: glycosyltransferase, partial [Stackebrandtia sp.]
MNTVTSVPVPMPLCVMLPEIGVVSETFLRWDVRDLAPGRVSVIADPPPHGLSITHPPTWDTGDAPTLAFSPVPGDPLPDCARQRAVAEFLHQHRVERVVLEYFDFADRWFDLITGLGIPVWVRGHGIDISARLREPGWADKYRRFLRAEGLIVPSRAAADRLTGLGLPSSHIHVVRYCVTVPDTPPPPRPPDQTVRCVAVGRLVEKKAPLVVLEAFRRAHHHNRALTLDVVGDGPLAGQARSFVTRHDLTGVVRFHGALPHTDAVAVTTGADIVIHHSRTAAGGDAEGQPLSILEAMAAAKPVISTIHEGIPEVITDRVNGRLTAPGDIGATAQVLID